MQSIKKTGHIIVGQILFFILFILYYLRNSFLRPMNSTDVELILALIIVVGMAVNYWLLYPLIYLKHSFWMYAIATILEAAMAVLLEYHLTFDSILQLIPKEAILPDKSSIRFTLLLNYFFRDICLMAFAGLMADNLGQKFKLLETDNLMLRRKNQIFAQRNGKEDFIIDASSICYVQQRQNYTRIFTIDGQDYERRGSLNYFEEAPKGLNGVKISRNTIVFMPYVQALNDKEVTVITMQNPITSINLPLGKSIAPSAILEIERYLHQKAKNKVTETDKNLENIIDQNSSLAIVKEKAPENKVAEQYEPQKTVKRESENNKSSMIRKYISLHRDCNIKDIVSATQIPKSTVTRYLKELQAQNLIEYVGSKKTGGYRVVEKKEDTSER